ncbi:hypothetical protein [Simkania sp.]|uniref:hypothetical protein n=1 Tax=Simkania sp. TaxID=34094 RepID=UPI003B521DCB
MSPEEKRKLIGLVDPHAFEKIDRSLAEEIGKMGDEPKVIEIFQPVIGYSSAPDFPKFVEYIRVSSSREWGLIKDKLFTCFPEMRQQFIQMQIEMFVKLRPEVQAEACWRAYETDPSIFKGRLETLLQSDQDYELTRACDLLVKGNPPAAARLFHHYQNRFLRDQVSLYSKDASEAEDEFFDEWKAYFDFKIGTILSPLGFSDKMKGVLREPACRRAVADFLSEVFD